MPPKGLDRKTAAHYVLAISEGGDEYIRPGGFYAKLFDAALHADRFNLDAIGAGFPSVAEAVILYKWRLDGRETLIRRAAE